MKSTTENVTGQLIAGYQVGEQIAVGGMGTVYHAHTLTTNDPVAIKILNADYAQNPEFNTRFEREAYLLMRLDHPNIVPVFDFGHSDGVTFLVMQLIRGPSLFQLQHQRRFSPHAIVELLTPLTEALDYAHDEGVIHRDIKPGNVLIEFDTPDTAKTADLKHKQAVYLTDFGLSKAQGDASLTVLGKSLGTPQYMSPEQVMNYPIDRRSDVYALGLLIYELLLGRLPFYGRNAQEVAYMHVKDQPPAPRSLIGAFPAPIEEVLMRALAKSPKERFATATEFGKAYVRGLDRLRDPARHADYWVGVPNGA